MAPLIGGLLDTSVVIAAAEEPGIEVNFPDQVAISAATLAELHFGVLLAKDELTRQLRLRRLGVIESSIQTLPIDSEVARAFAAIAHAVKLAGRQPRARVMDHLIAATALAHRIPLYTRNPDDFKGLEHHIALRVV